MEMDGGEGIVGEGFRGFLFLSSKRELGLLVCCSRFACLLRSLLSLAMTDKVWYAEGLAPDRHDSPVNGNGHVTNGVGNGNGDYDFDAGDVRAVNHVPITRLQRPWVNPKNSPLKDPGTYFFFFLFKSPAVL